MDPVKGENWHPVVSIQVKCTHASACVLVGGRLCGLRVFFVFVCMCACCPLAFFQKDKHVFDLNLGSNLCLISGLS